MIISHKHKFIFIKTAKTAGTSIEIALSKICGPKDIITPIAGYDEKYRKKLGIRGPQNYIIPFRAYNVFSKTEIAQALYHRQRKTFYNHISAEEIKKLIPENIWNNYYKFTFERNPYDRVISMFYWLGRKDKYTSILDFILKGKADPVRGFNLYTIGSIPVVDKIYKFEDMDFFLEDISQKLNLKEKLELPPQKTKGSVRKDKRHYREILTPEEAKWISIIFAREIALLNYEF